MRKNLWLVLWLSACAAPTEPVLTPVPVDMPVVVPCAALPIAQTPNKLDALSSNASLTDFVKACAAQTLGDRDLINQYRAAFSACAPMPRSSLN